MPGSPGTRLRLRALPGTYGNRFGWRCSRVHFATGWLERNAVTPAIAHEVGSLEIAECPVSGIARTCAFGYCDAVRRASSSGVRRSSRPETTSTGTFGPVWETPAGFGVDGQPAQTAAELNDSTAVGEKGAHALAGRARIALVSALTRPASGLAGSHGRRSSTQLVASSRIGLNSFWDVTSE